MEPAKSSLTFNVLNALIVVLIFVIYAYWRTYRQQIHKVSANIPGRKGYPFIGNATDMLGSPHSEEKNNNCVD